MTNDPAVLFVRPAAISKADKVALRKVGVVVVEIDNPAEVKFLRPSQEISGGELLAAAASVIKKSDYTAVRAAFGRAVCEAIESKHEAPPSDKVVKVESMGKAK